MADMRIYHVRVHSQSLPMPKFDTNRTVGLKLLVAAITSAAKEYQTRFEKYLKTAFKSAWCACLSIRV